MHVLIGIALKSLVVAGLALGLLAFMERRSAAERSWVAHIGLLALVIMAFAPLALPSWNVEAPAIFGQALTAEATVLDSPRVSPRTTMAVASIPLAAKSIPHIKVPARASLSPAAAATALYAVPAAILLLITFLALARLIALRARADVLVDAHWLSALARAQRRMGFKHGTALLTSNELSSPISWGLMRPVILLNSRAVEASDEAEAIIAHELAHVARMDWVKLLLARIATALFWFNPLVWMLAREAHQLREEAADDTVLAADILDTDYAQLLVGVARHECPALLLGAHGVAPSKSSLSRRVARVLDGKSVRGPVARSFALGVFVGAVMIAAPLAAITLTPAGAAKKSVARDGSAPAANVGVGKPYYAANDTPTDLPHIIVSGVSTSVATVKAAVDPDAAAQAEREAQTDAASDALKEARRARIDAARDAIAEARDAREEALADAREALAEARAGTRVEVRTKRLDNGHIDQIIELRASGVSADYVNQMRTAQPRLVVVSPSEFAGMKNVGVTPQFARDLAAAGFRNLTADELTQARAVGLNGDYVRAMAAAGIPLSLGDYIQLHAVGVPTSYVLRIKKAGYSVRNADKIVEMWAVGVKPEDLRLGVVNVQPPQAPRTPAPPPPPDPDKGDG